MPLIIAPRGKPLRVVKTSVEEKLKMHLANLGILAGAEIVLLSQQNGDVIIKIKDSKLALNKQLATKITVAYGG